MPLHICMEIPADTDAIACAVEALTALNYWMMRKAAVGGRGFPALYASGIVYRQEPAGNDDWQHAGRLHASGQGDCEDLAAYRAAELRLEGEPAMVVIKKTGRGSYHAVVRRADGTIEDPSRIAIQIEQGKARQ